MSKQVQIDLEALDALVESKAQALILGMRDQISAPLEKRLAEAAALGAQPQHEEFHDCESPLTGATFRVRVLESRAFPKGRIVDLLDYTHPPRAHLHQDEGGLVPNGKPIDSADYKMWLWNEFWKRDLTEFVGKPFISYYSKAEADARRAAEAAKA